MNSNRISNTARERKTQYPEMELETGDTGKLPDHGQRLSSVPRRRPLPSTAAAGVEQRGGRGAPRRGGACSGTRRTVLTRSQLQLHPPGGDRLLRDKPHLILTVPTVRTG